MHISTTALSVVLLSFLGGLQTAHAMEYKDAYGVTKYGFQCEGRVYTKPVIFAAAKNLCDKIQNSIYSNDAYRSAHEYNTMINMRASELLKLYYTFTPIFADGRLFAFESDSPKKSAGRKVWIDPGPDRLVIDENCNVMGAFTDQDYTRVTDTARVKACRVLNSKEDVYLSLREALINHHEDLHNDLAKNPQKDLSNLPEDLLNAQNLRVTSILSYSKSPWMSPNRSPE